MKIRLLTLSVLAAMAVPAMAQTNVTLYGQIGLELGRNIGSKDTVIQNGANSRLGIRGTEELGGGHRAFFNIENRFEPDTGVQSDAARFWNGRSVVGLEGGYGRIWAGRDYTPLFWDVSLKGDPWSYTGIGALDSGLASIGTSRYDNTLNYSINAAGFGLWLQVAERANNGNGAGTAAAVDRPMGASLSYSAGPLYVSLGFDSRTNDADELWGAVATYDFRFMKLYGTYVSGTTAANVDHREMVFAASMPLGAGQLRAGIDQLKRTSGTSVTLKQQVSLGYHYSLSKRTTLFADVTNDNKVAQNKTGFGIGMKHMF